MTILDCVSFSQNERLEPVFVKVSLFTGTRCKAGDPWRARLCHLWDPGLGFLKFSRRLPLTGSLAQLMGLPIPLCPCRRLSYRRATGTLPSPQSLKKPTCK